MNLDAASLATATSRGGAVLVLGYILNFSKGLFNGHYGEYPVYLETVGLSTPENCSDTANMQPSMCGPEGQSLLPRVEQLMRTSRI